MIVQQMRQLSVDAMGSREGRVADLLASVRLAVDRICGTAKITDEMRSAAIRSVAPADDLPFDAFHVFLELIGAVGAIEDKLRLFDWIDVDGKGIVSVDELAGSILGTRRTPLASSEFRAALASLNRKVAQRCKASGSARDFVRVLVAVDKTSSGLLTASEFDTALQRFGITVSRIEADMIIKHLDSTGSGASVRLSELLRYFRGHMPLRRRRAVDSAWSAVDPTMKGAVAIDSLQKQFAASQHPSVGERLKSAADVTREFAAAIELRHGKDVLTRSEFIDLYKDLSLTVDSDKDFELMVKAVWTVKDSVGQSATASTVLVTQRNGNQVLRQVESGAAEKATASSFDALKASLEASGLTDIVRIERFAPIPF